MTEAMQSGLSLLSSFGLLLLCIRTYHVSSFFMFNFPSIICNDYHNSKLILQSTYSTDTTTTTNESSNKRIVLIRHGCTYMNEYLSIPGSRWGDPQFTDVFTDPEDIAKYRDSPLSERGIRQAESLSSRLGKEDNILEEIQLIAVSPLKRALQTMKISLYPNLWPGKVPIIALPQASERVYLISDLGTSTKQLKKQYPIVDFDSEITNDKSDSWWISDSTNTTTNYKEWRPNNDGQTYAEPGEIESAFNQRMVTLYDWLAQRPESTIALICHWGVLEWLTGYDFDNCEMRVVDFADMKRTGFMISDDEFNEIFKDGERSVIQDTQ